MWLEAKAEDAPEIAEAIERCKVVFEPATAESIEYNLRVLPPDVLKLARGLIDELYNEKFDPSLAAAYELQTDAVHQTVSAENHITVYEWLATVAEPGQKRAFMNTLAIIRDVALDLGREGIAEEMIRQRFAVADILSATEFTAPSGDSKISSKAYKRKVLRDSKATSFASTKASISKQFNTFANSLVNDDKVEDALNTLPLHSLDVDVNIKALQLNSKIASTSESYDVVRVRDLVEQKLAKAPGDSNLEESDLAGGKKVRSDGIFGTFIRRRNGT
jgi:hypothetical protein